MIDAPAFADRAVEARFAEFPKAVRTPLLAARHLIFNVASETDGVGPLTETLKWGQPAYLTEATKSGTTVRLGAPAEDRWGVYVHCQTQVIPALRSTMGDVFTFDGTRGVIFEAKEPFDEAALRTAIRSALTYHIEPKSRG